MLAHPYLPSCDDCVAWQYDTETWQRLGDDDSDRRGPDDPTPCWKCPKIPRGEPATPATGRQSELSDRNWAAYLHYLRCKAVRRFPDDEIVEHNAGVIRMIEDQEMNAAARQSSTASSMLVTLMLNRLRGR